MTRQQYLFRTLAILLVASLLFAGVPQVAATEDNMDTEDETDSTQPSGGDADGTTTRDDNSTSSNATSEPTTDETGNTTDSNASEPPPSDSNGNATAEPTSGSGDTNETTIHEADAANETGDSDSTAFQTSPDNQTSSSQSLITYCDIWDLVFTILQESPDCPEDVDPCGDGTTDCISTNPCDYMPAGDECPPSTDPCDYVIGDCPPSTEPCDYVIGDCPPSTNPCDYMPAGDECPPSTEPCDYVIGDCPPSTNPCDYQPAGDECPPSTEPCDYVIGDCPPSTNPCDYQPAGDECPPSTDPCDYVPDLTMASSETECLDEFVDLVCATIDVDANGDCLPVAPEDCLPPSPSSVSSSGNTGPLSMTVDSLETLRRSVVHATSTAAFSNSGLGTISLSYQPQSNELIQLLQTYVGDNDTTAAQLVDAYTKLANSDSLESSGLSTIELTMLALSAPPSIGKTGYHMAGYGAEWYDLVQDRYVAVDHEIRTAYDDSSKNEYGWPNDETVQETLGPRLERFLLGATLLYLGFYESNSHGTLYDSLPLLHQIAFGMTMDIGTVYWETAAASSSPCEPILELYAFAMSTANALLELILSLPDEVAWQLQEFAEVWNGTWYDLLIPTASSLVTILDAESAAGYAVLRSIMQDASPVQGAYHGALLQGVGVVGTVHRTLPKGGALTDQAEVGRWGVDILESQTALTEVDWRVPLPAGPEIGMDSGVLMITQSSPTIFEESGTEWQDTSYEYVLLHREERPPGWVAGEPEWSYGQCMAAGIGASIIITAGGAAIFTGALGGPTGGGAMAAGAGLIAGALFITFEARERCNYPPGAYDPGMYVEVGAYINYWGDTAWYGDGVSIAGGIVNIFGTALNSAPTPVTEAIEYDNKEDTTGWYAGKDMAAAKRENARQEMLAKLAQFRSVATAGTDAYITIEILCEGIGDYFESSEPDDGGRSIAPIDPDSVICVRATIGGSPAGGLQAAGYGPVNQELRAAGDSGYINVNGQQVNAPGVLELEASGENTG